MTTDNLPAQSSVFIGRSHELAEIAQLLAEPTCRLLTLVGPGGSGKTRLAMQVAAEQLANFRAGVYFVPLAPLSDPANIPSAVATVMGLSLDGSGTPEQQLINYLSKKRLLLVLDNFEHLMDGTALVADILSAALGVKLLVTSREALNLQEEWLRRVDGMRFPTSSAVENVADYSAVQLFVERSRRIRAAFSSDDEAEAVARICRLVQGMPLAIELAAAWLKTMNCGQIADEIQRNLDFLASLLRNTPERHRSIRAIFDQSWQLLSREEHAVFEVLSVSRGGFTREAAKHVANTSLMVLTALVDKSLLQLTAHGRYDVHELLRQYAEQQLESSGETTNARVRHNAYYLDFLAKRETDLKGRRQTAAVNEIKVDFENIRLA